MTLSDTQLLILSAASQRTDHAATLPANLKGSAAKKVIDRLLKQQLLQELRAKDDMPVWRRGGDNRPYTLRITKGGLKAIEVEDVADAPDENATPGPDDVVATNAPAETNLKGRPAAPGDRVRRRRLRHPRKQPKHHRAGPTQTPNRIGLSLCFDSQEAQPWMYWSTQPDGRNTRCAASWPARCARS